MEQDAPKKSKEALRTLITKLHQGADTEQVKREFKKLLGDVSATDIARIEEELIKEGMPREEIQRFCDVHLAVFKESLEKERPLAPTGHPINILLEEHRMLLQFAEQLKRVAGEMKGATDLAPSGEKMKQLDHVVKHFKASASHYVREENVLFPELEKRGVTEPPKIMWMEHNKIRETEKRLYAAVDALGARTPGSGAVFGSGAAPQGAKVSGPGAVGPSTGASDAELRELREAAGSLAEMLSSHFYKENNILFPAAMRVVPPQAWPDLRVQFDELGYCCFTPEPARRPMDEAHVHGPQAATPETQAATGRTGTPAEPSAAVAAPGTTCCHAAAAPGQKGAAPAAPSGSVPTPGAPALISLETGTFSRDELMAVLNSLPIDITFVDADDTVRYFSDSKDRIFPRTRAIIGRKVQLCHPQESVHVVTQILEAFKTGRRDVAEFWINLGGKLVYIRYFAVRGKRNEYLGCVEVSQDVTDIKKMEGQKRLLDWS
ncbi:MAG: DUF438 domain-containing protein [Candidatus Eisenbacteria bacterium]